MKGLLAAASVLGALAVGGLPTLTQTLAADPTGTERAAGSAHAQPSGPPEWANGLALGHDPAAKERHKAERREALKDRAKGGPGLHRGHGHAFGRDKGRRPGGWTPHGWAVREWAHCVADATAAAGNERPDLRAACGAKPVPLKHRR